MGKQVQLRDGFNEMKLELMYKLLKMKFRPNSPLGKKLQNIHGEIIEENTWHDTFWGVCNGIGENHLGKLLMKIRDELQK